MKNVILIGKQFGEFEGNKYYQLFFTEVIPDDKGEGSKPYVRQSGITTDGKPKFSQAIGCTASVFDCVVVGEVFDVDGFLFNARGKLASIE